MSAGCTVMSPLSSTCQFCKGYNQTDKVLNAHVARTHDRWRCLQPKCDSKLIEGYGNLIAHVKIKHPRLHAISCTMCNMKSKTISDWLRHATQKHRGDTSTDASANKRTSQRRKRPKTTSTNKRTSPRRPQTSNAQRKEVEVAKNLPSPLDENRDVQAAMSLPAPVDENPNVKEATNLPAAVDEIPDIEAAMNCPVPVDEIPDVEAAMNRSVPVDENRDVKAAINLPPSVDENRNVEAAINLPASVNENGDVEAGMNLQAPAPVHENQDNGRCRVCFCKSINEGQHDKPVHKKHTTRESDGRAQFECEVCKEYVVYTEAAKHGLEEHMYEYFVHCYFCNHRMTYVALIMHALTCTERPPKLTNATLLTALANGRVPECPFVLETTETSETIQSANGVDSVAPPEDTYNKRVTVKIERQN